MQCFGMRNSERQHDAYVHQRNRSPPSARSPWSTFKSPTVPCVDGEMKAGIRLQILHGLFLAIVILYHEGFPRRASPTSPYLSIQIPSDHRPLVSAPRTSWEKRAVVTLHLCYLGILAVYNTAYINSTSVLRWMERISPTQRLKFGCRSGNASTAEGMVSTVNCDATWRAAIFESSVFRLRTRFRCCCQYFTAEINKLISI